MSNDTLPEWSGVTDLASWLNVPEATVYAWNHRGTGPTTYRIGRHVRYRRDDVLAWLESCKGTPTERTV